MSEENAQLDGYPMKSSRNLGWLIRTIQERALLMMNTKGNERGFFFYNPDHGWRIRGMTMP